MFESSEEPQKRGKKGFQAEKGVYRVAVLLTVPAWRESKWKDGIQSLLRYLKPEMRSATLPQAPVTRLNHQSEAERS